MKYFRKSIATLLLVVMVFSMLPNLIVFAGTSFGVGSDMPTAKSITWSGSGGVDSGPCGLGYLVHVNPIPDSNPDAKYDSYLAGYVLNGYEFGDGSSDNKYLHTIRKYWAGYFTRAVDAIYVFAAGSPIPRVVNPNNSGYAKGYWSGNELKAGMSDTDVTLSNKRGLYESGSLPAASTDSKNKSPGRKAIDTMLKDTKLGATFEERYTKWLEGIVNKSIPVSSFTKGSKTDAAATSISLIKYSSSGASNFVDQFSKLLNSGQTEDQAKAAIADFNTKRLEGKSTAADLEKIVENYILPTFAFYADCMTLRTEETALVNMWEKTFIDYATRLQTYNTITDKASKDKAAETLYGLNPGAIIIEPVVVFRNGSTQNIVVSWISTMLGHFGYTVADSGGEWAKPRSFYKKLTETVGSTYKEGSAAASSSKPYSTGTDYYCPKGWNALPVAKQHYDNEMTMRHMFWDGVGYPDTRGVTTADTLTLYSKGSSVTQNYYGMMIFSPLYTGPTASTTSASGGDLNIGFDVALTTTSKEASHNSEHEKEGNKYGSSTKDKPDSLDAYLKGLTATGKYTFPDNIELAINLGVDDPATRATWYMAIKGYKKGQTADTFMKNLGITKELESYMTDNKLTEVKPILSGKIKISYKIKRDGKDLVGIIAATTDTAKLGTNSINLKGTANTLELTGDEFLNMLSLDFTKSFNYSEMKGSNKQQNALGGGQYTDPYSETAKVNYKEPSVSDANAEPDTYSISLSYVFSDVTISFDYTGATVEKNSIKAFNKAATDKGTISLKATYGGIGEKDTATSVTVTRNWKGGKVAPEPLPLRGVAPANPYFTWAFRTGGIVTDGSGEVKLQKANDKIPGDSEFAVALRVKNTDEYNYWRWYLMGRNIMSGITPDYPTGKIFDSSNPHKIDGDYSDQSQILQGDYAKDGFWDGHPPLLPKSGVTIVGAEAGRDYTKLQFKVTFIREATAIDQTVTTDKREKLFSLSADVFLKMIGSPKAYQEGPTIEDVRANGAWTEVDTWMKDEISKIEFKEAGLNGVPNPTYITIRYTLEVELQQLAYFNCSPDQVKLGNPAWGTAAYELLPGSPTATTAILGAPAQKLECGDWDTKKKPPKFWGDDLAKQESDKTEVTKPRYERIYFKKADPPVDLIPWISTPVAYSEVKEGTQGAEKWEAMAGVPSTEKLYYASGGSTFIIDIMIRFQPEPQIINRNYQIYNDCTACKDNGSATCSGGPEIKCGCGAVTWIAQGWHGSGLQCDGSSPGENHSSGNYSKSYGGCGKLLEPEVKEVSHMEDIKDEDGTVTGQKKVIDVAYKAAVYCTSGGSGTDPAPLHSACRPHHVGGHYNTTWSQKVTNVMYAEIVALTVWRIADSQIDGMDRIIVTANRDGSGNEIQNKSGINTLNTNTPSAWPQLYWNAAQANTSREGRIWYNVEPYAYDSVVWHHPTRSDNEHSNKADGDSVNEYLLWNTSPYGGAKVNPRVISDCLILRTADGDQSILYFEQLAEEAQEASSTFGTNSKPANGKDIKMKDVARNDIWEGNPYSAANWNVKDTINVTSYNGDWSAASGQTAANQERKYGDSTPRSNIDFDNRTVWGGKQSAIVSGNCTSSLGSVGTPWGIAGGTSFGDVSGRTKISMRTYVSKPSITKIYSNSYEINIRNINGEYQTGQSDVFFECLIDFKKPTYSKGGSIPSSENGRAPEYSSKTDARFSGQYSNYGFIYLNAPYASGKTKVNNIVIHNPVSTQNSFVFSLPKERDQRTQNASYLKEQVNDLDLTNPSASANLSPEIIVGNKIFTPANFLNLDWGFQTYFPNLGDFAGLAGYSLGNTVMDRGLGYTNNMDTGAWVQRKWIVCNFDVVINYGLSTQRQINAGTPIVLFDRGSDYYSTGDDVGNLQEFVQRMYIPSADAETDYGRVDFYATAINSISPYAVYNTQPNNKGRFSVLNGKMNASYGDASSFYVLDIVGRIGNLVMEDTSDPRYSMLFKNSLSTFSWSVPNLLYKINPVSARNYFGDSVDIRGIPLEGSSILYDAKGGYGQVSVTTNNKYLNTYGMHPYREKTPLTFPLSPTKNTWDSTKTGKNTAPALQQYGMLKGYNAYMDITTLGSYDLTMQINPKWYFVDLTNVTDSTKGASARWIPIDIYQKTDSSYNLINRFNLMGHNTSANNHAYLNYKDLYQNKISKVMYNIDWEATKNHRNFTPQLEALYNAYAQIPSNEIIVLTDSNGNGIGVTAGEYIPDQTLWGSNNPAGSVQFIQLYADNALYSGSSKVNGVEINNESRISPESFALNTKQWVFDLGIPSSARFVESSVNTTWQTKVPTEIDFAILEGRIGVLVCTIDIMAIGRVWNLRYTGGVPSTIGLFRPYTQPEGSSPTENPGFSVDIPIPQSIIEGDPNKPYIPGEGPSNIPVVIVDPTRSSSNFDLTTSGTH